MTFTKTADEVFAGYGAGGNPRSIDNGDAQTWGTEIETMVSAISGGILISTVPTTKIKTASFVSNGFAAANDFGFGAVYVAGTSAGVMAIQDANSAWFELSVNQPLRAGYFGATPNNSTDCASEFSKIILALCGSIIDLRGGTYYTSATPPAHVQFINGTIRHSGRYETFPSNSILHPFDGAKAMELEHSPATHIWPGPVGEMLGASDETLLISYVMGYRHEVSAGAPLMLTSRSGGGAPEKQCVLWSHRDYEPRGLQGGMLDSTTFGVGFLMQDAATNYPATDGMKFVRTSDAGVTATEEVMVAALADYYYPHSSQIMANGDLWIFGVRASRYIIAQKRSAAGTWSAPISLCDYQATAFYTGPGDTIGEAYGVWCEGYGWLVSVRDNDGSQANLYSLIANADFSTVGALVNSGLPNSTNPPCHVFWNGWIVYYVSSRTGGAVGGRKDEVQFQCVKASDVFDADGVATGLGPSGIAGSFGGVAISYLDVKRLPSGRWAAVGIDMEPQAGSANPSSSRLFLIGGGDFVSAAPQAAQRRALRFGGLNLGWHNGARGDSFTGITSNTKTVPMWWHSSASSCDVVRTKLNGSSWAQMQLCLPHRPAYALAITRASGTTSEQKFRVVGREAMSEWSATNIALGRWIGGAFPTGTDGHRIEISFYAGSGGSGAPSTVTRIQTVPQNSSTGLTLIEDIATIPDLSGITWGTDPEDPPYIQVSWIFNATGAVTIYDFGAWFNEGDRLVIPGPADTAAENILIEKWCKNLRLVSGALLTTASRTGSDNAGTGLFTYGYMAKTPTVSLVSPATYASFNVGGSALTALQFRAGSPSHCECVTTRTGYWTAYDMRAVTANATVEILIDAQ